MYQKCERIRSPSPFLILEKLHISLEHHEIRVVHLDIKQTTGYSFKFKITSHAIILNKNQKVIA